MAKNIPFIKKRKGRNFSTILERNLAILSGLLKWKDFSDQSLKIGKKKSFRGFWSNIGIVKNNFMKQRKLVWRHTQYDTVCDIIVNSNLWFNKVVHFLDLASKSASNLITGVTLKLIFSPQ